MGTWLLIAVGLLAVTWTWPTPSVWLRVLGIILDVAAITWALYLLDARGSGLVFIYLCIVLGTGFRYGRGYLFFSQGISVLGLSLLTINASSWWQSNINVSVGWLIALVVIPTYVDALIERLKVARAKAEEALRECIERQPRLS